MTIESDGNIIMNRTNGEITKINVTDQSSSTLYPDGI